MSDLLYDVLSILAVRSRAAHERQLEAKGIYARFMLNAKSEEESADAVIAAADELGFGIDEVCRDLVVMQFAKVIPKQIDENDKAVANARAAILQAKRQLTAARGGISRTAVDRANANLHERVSDAVALEEWGESLKRGLDVFKERGETFKADIDAAAVAKREAEQRKKQFAAEGEAPRAEAGSQAQGAAVGTVDPPSPAPGAAEPDQAEARAPAGDTASAREPARDPGDLGEPIIADLSPKPVP